MQQNAEKARALVLALTVLLLLGLQPSLEAQPTVYLVRHAEKLPNWPGGSVDIFHPLSADGVARAQRLADLFAPGSLAAIFASRTTRCLHTALPLAEKLGLQIEVTEACMDTTAIDSFFSDLRQRFRPDQAVLLVSHSNIIPYLLLKAGLPDSCREKMGITSSTKHHWLLIEGYENVWKVDGASAAGKACGPFQRRRF